jgi:hypothetical protein
MSHFVIKAQMYLRYLSYMDSHLGMTCLIIFKKKFLLGIFLLSFQNLNILGV